MTVLPELSAKQFVILTKEQNSIGIKHIKMGTASHQLIRQAAAGMYEDYVSEFGITNSKRAKRSKSQKRQKLRKNYV